QWNGDEEIVVAVEDPTDGDQPHGKQSRKSENIFYTPSSGIWQTVWLEPVPKICIDDLQFTPDIDKNVLHIKATAGSRLESLKVEIVALSSNQEIARISGPVNRELTLPIAAPHLWTPDDPFLYDLKVTLKDDNRTLDSVTSYFGMRKIALKKDGEGKTRIALNNQFAFEMGALDQGYWPDGIYTAPTDEALRFDIGALKRAGFNLARKHVKVEPDRWYYWCDKLGLLVWQDMPWGKNTTPESRMQFETELQRMVEGRGNHPCIIVWVLFNEGWGQYDTERLAPWLKSIDPSRLVDDASGWTDKRVGDIIDTHSYPGPESPQPEADRAAVLGEFGGLMLKVTGHTWSSQSWGYQPMPDAETLNSHYQQLAERVHYLNYYFGLSAAVYTQTADVETECNGLMTYDRAIFKLDLAKTLAANVTENQQKHYQYIVPNALTLRVPWKYTTEKPDDQWFKPGFADAVWKEGIGGFGTQGTPNTMLNTTWGTADIWLRREFTLGNEDLGRAVFLVHHDEDAEIYLNGVLAATLPGFDTIYLEQKINPEALAVLKPGVNLIAVHCHQTSGGQFIDAGIVIPPPAKPDEVKK
ncbi:MAG: glycoside hydrolase family 2, partial [Verrucomicrobia bacterium]|nr:glycoside hydrolase family 2 [Verrucomicrobiota bacterium]